MKSKAKLAQPTVDVARDRRDSRWDAHREQRRAELVGTTVAAIRQHGAGVGMDEIATAAGTSKTAVYRHFRDRAGLYTAVCHAVARVLTGQIRRATDRALAEGAGPHAAVAAGIDAYLRLIESDREVYRFVVQRPLLGAAVAGTDPVTDLVTVIGDQVAEAMESHLPGAPAARTWGHALVGMVRGAADDWLARPTGTTRDELTARLTDLAWTGLAGLATSPRAARGASIDPSGARDASTGTAGGTA
ncbi:TetR/AcrR family transcriptional regulator [Pseudonocardia sp. RS11V-5]|uniref:TetR/AcrR family transcriptional regulator n=1 Tax=Pseudonocardia terrae TaxID=2905831 RepID=UPI001E2D3C6A|nr:TetR family transcriptional regulator [Pseudonocardia terrae]MCE3552635.1 TetR/AcrR family transcriptional regulator [Pseudonocardia terrae]